MIALLWLLGMSVGEQVMPLIKRVAEPEPITSFLAPPLLTAMLLLADVASPQPR